MYYKEIGLGLGAALVFFLAAKGYDVVPLIFLGAAAGLLYYFLQSRGMVKSLVIKGNEEEENNITFADIGGQRAAVEELKEALDFIKHYPQARRLGVRPLKGILLTGPPGTGKTLLAKAAAGYTDAVFIAASGSEFVEMYAGVGAQRIRNLFRLAREKAQQSGKNRAIIFIDEIDVLGGKRGKVNSHLEYDQTLNQLLVEMDGIKGDEKVNILVIAATNRADLLDPALLRPGRFDRQVRVDLPDKEGRLEILRLHTRNKPLAPDVDLEAVAKETLGFSGAHLESLANEAAILALREGASAIGQRHFMEAIERVMLGARLERRPSKEELWRVAVHETGHALVSEWVRPGSVTTLTVTPRGGALGYFRQQYEEDSYLYTQEQLEDRLAVLLAGVVAEEVVLGSRSTGAANNFEQATRVAETMIRAGMSRLGVAGSAELPEETRHELLREILSRQEERVQQYLRDHREKLIYIAQELLAAERLTGERFRQLLRKEESATSRQEK
ncbi:Vesicle-fusing ATPase [Ammonifex degensii KC4]|uniref:Vesicle-fusing ATPase n=1 Tax=Ammonifex degensii (strain DSM 10501 / KC4) TaxID=429009 RepID=C9RBZ6_AMMDK|nr:AAA family ATPase [Ammonifex degensii]ACX51773.1 Vesicle-fusing ATPase [Ammonifex degensii KC4]